MGSENFLDFKEKFKILIDFPEKRQKITSNSRKWKKSFEVHQSRFKSLKVQKILTVHLSSSETLKIQSP
jgi:hypothetical protein